ncbi:hypothetical protein F2Q70_00039521 [Brassica cretica]|uniref:TFIIS-type domain-containing protein n=1 Tax=Brassica cretica TaxID=69181 RepID=A0A8S9K3P8_BRACR|nr:hypothetical protein F2Q70_00039521 [Brassica cretica]
MSFNGLSQPLIAKPATMLMLVVSSVNTHASQRECQPSCSTGIKKDKGCCYVSFSRWTNELQRTVSAFTCKTCNNANVGGVLRYEAADDNCVYRNEVHHSVSEQTQILSDVASDPTLPRTKAVRCAKCQHGEAVFFQATARGEEGMTLFFVCCNPNCGHRWRE